jgi:hypothetical protein
MNVSLFPFLRPFLMALAVMSQVHRLNEDVTDLLEKRLRIPVHFLSIIRAVCSGSLQDKKRYVRSGKAAQDIAQFLTSALSQVEKAVQGLSADDVKKGLNSVGGGAMDALGGIDSRLPRFVMALFRIGSSHEPRLSSVLQELLTALDPSYFRDELALLCQILTNDRRPLSDENVSKLIVWFSNDSVTGMSRFPPLACDTISDILLFCSQTLCSRKRLCQTCHVCALHASFCL